MVDVILELFNLFDLRLQIQYILYEKLDLALNNQKWLKYHKTEPNQNLSLG